MKAEIIRRELKQVDLRGKEFSFARAAKLRSASSARRTGIPETRRRTIGAHRL